MWLLTILALGQTSATSTSLNIDVNAGQMILHSRMPIDWNDLTIEFNGWWTFTLHGVPMGQSICVNLDAFKVKPVVRGGKADYEGIYFDPESMKVVPRMIHVRFPNRSEIPIDRATAGMFKPLTPSEIRLRCVGHPARP